MSFARERQGFTLVEVLVAFTIIALTLTMAMRVLAEGAGIAKRGPAQAARMEEAASIMARLVADPRLALGDTSGVFPDGTRWHVRCTDVTTLVAASSGARLIRIEFFPEPSARRPALVTIALGAPA
jgi:general secretion pathway protein I